LRRPIDLVEAGMIAGLVLLFVIAAPVLATMTGRWTRATVTPEQRAEIAGRQMPAAAQRGAPSLDGPRARGRREIWTSERHSIG
jgi:hypothetical protein